MAVETKVRKPGAPNWVGIFFGGLFAVAVFTLVITLISGGGKGPTQTVVYVQGPQQPAQVVVQPTKPAAPKLVNEMYLYVIAMDPEANLITNGTVELWKVTNVTKITEKAFYATEGYTVWMNKSLDESGTAEFKIARAQWLALKQWMKAVGAKLYAIVIPGGNYYRAGKELPDLSPYFYENNNTLTLSIKVPKIAQYFDINNPVFDIRGLSAGDTKSKEYSILTVSENEKGILKIYKFVVKPGALSNLTAQFEYLKLTIGGKTIDLIKDGEVKLTENKEITIPVKEVKAGESVSIKLEGKLKAAPDTSLDGVKIVDIDIYDVRDSLIGTASVTLNTA